MTEARGEAGKSVGERWQGWPAIGRCGPGNQRLGKLRAIVGIGHHYHALAGLWVEDRITLITDILAPFHQHEGGAVARDRGAEPVGTAILARQHLLPGIAAKEDWAIVSPVIGYATSSLARSVTVDQSPAAARSRKMCQRPGSSFRR